MSFQRNIKPGMILQLVEIGYVKLPTGFFMFKSSWLGVTLTVLLVASTCWGDTLEVTLTNSHPSVDFQVKSFSYVPHQPISLNSNEDFANSDFPGSGTSDDPYIIEGLNITVSNYNEDLISIVGTRAHFILRNNYINGLSTAWGGIVLTNVENAKIENNIITKVDSQAVALYQSQHSIVVNNTIGYSSNAIRLENSANYNIIVNNTLLNTLMEGIIIEGASHNNSFISNYISHCFSFAFMIDNTSGNNTVNWNSFLANQRISGSQATDSGSNNLFSYNHWDDWTSPDTNYDGIVDVPYQIAGYVINLDRFPLVEPIQNSQILNSPSGIINDDLLLFPVDGRLLLSILFLLTFIGLLGVSIRKQRLVD